jgi:hypothetical protein
MLTEYTSRRELKVEGSDREIAQGKGLCSIEGEAMMKEQRKNERRKLIAFTPVYDCKRNLFLGYLGDLSMKGAMMIGKKPMEVNKQLTLAIGFPETPEFPARRATLSARIAWCRTEKNPLYYNTGFEFQEMDDENKTAIRAILEKYRFRYKTPA